MFHGFENGNSRHEFSSTNLNEKCVQISNYIIITLIIVIIDLIQYYSVMG